MRQHVTNDGLVALHWIVCATMCTLKAFTLHASLRIADIERAVQKYISFTSEHKHKHMRL